MGRGGGRGGGGGGRSSSGRGGSSRSSSFGSGRGSHYSRPIFSYRPIIRPVIRVGGGVNNVHQSGAEQQTTPPPKPEYIVCKYCGTKRKYGSDETRCPSCGSAEMGDIIYDNGQTADCEKTADGAVKRKLYINWGQLLVRILFPLIVVGIITGVFLWDIYGPMSVRYKNIGEIYNTDWLNFKVISYERVLDYNLGDTPYTAPEGKVAIVVYVSIKNTSGEQIPIYYDDFYIMAGNSSSDQQEYEPVWNGSMNQYFDLDDKSVFKFNSYDNGKRCFNLMTNQTLSGLLVYEISEDASVARFNYEDWNDYRATDSYNIRLFGY